MDHPEQAGLDYVAELLGADLLERSIELIPGIVHQHVDAPIRFNRPAHRGLSRALVAHVELYRQQLVAILVAQRFQRFGSPRPRDNDRTSFQNRLRDVTTKSAASTRDQPHLRHPSSTAACWAADQHSLYYDGSTVLTQPGPTADSHHPPATPVFPRRMAIRPYRSYLMHCGISSPSNKMQE